MSSTLALVLSLVIVAANAFFVAAEFAFVKAAFEGMWAQYLAPQAA